MDIEQLCLKKGELPILGDTYKIFFKIPIHPKLLDPSLKIDKSIAQRIFPELTEVQFLDNGLAQTISMKEKGYGTLFFNNQELNYKSYAFTFINFSEEKYKEFASEKGGDNIFVYSEKDIDNFPKALFLRNWAIKYMNEVFRQVF